MVKMEEAVKGGEAGKVEREGRSEKAVESGKGRKFLIAHARWTIKRTPSAVKTQIAKTSTMSATPNEKFAFLAADATTSAANVLLSILVATGSSASRVNAAMHLVKTSVPASAARNATTVFTVSLSGATSDVGLCQNMTNQRLSQAPPANSGSELALDITSAARILLARV